MEATTFSRVKNCITNNLGFNIVKAVCLAVVFGLTLSACTTVNRTVGEAFNLDTDLKLEIAAGKFINPDEKGQTSPVFIRLYELTDDKVFAKANFIDLYERDEEILGGTFVAKQELKRIVPGTARSEQFVLSKDTRFVGLFAEFYDFKKANTKLIFPVTSSNVIRNTIKINVADKSISWTNKPSKYSNKASNISLP
ncbi:MAG: type VI secretion system lipoprotein TssJ [Agarilytica sp.]